MKKDKILKLFNDCSIPVILLGNHDKPCVIYSHRKVLNCFHEKDDLIFTKTFNNREELFRVKLKKFTVTTPELKTQIKSWLNNYAHRRCYRVKLKYFPAYLTGYNYLSKPKDGIPIGKYPVFSEFGFKYFFDKKVAKEKIEECLTSFELEIV